MAILMHAADNGFNWTALEPQLAVALARAARDTLIAEEESTKLRIDECENLLSTLKDEMDDIHARVEDANQQVASILSFLNQEGVQINAHPLHLNSIRDIPGIPDPSSSPRLPSNHSPSSDDSFSHSDSSSAQGDEIFD
jgi:hypothetical protein